MPIALPVGSGVLVRLAVVAARAAMMVEAVGVGEVVLGLPGGHVIVVVAIAIVVVIEGWVGI